MAPATNLEGAERDIKRLRVWQNNTGCGTSNQFKLFQHKKEGKKSVMGVAHQTTLMFCGVMNNYEAIMNLLSGNELLLSHVTMIN